MADALSAPNEVVAPGTEGTGYVPLASAGATALLGSDPAGGGGTTPTAWVTGPFMALSAGA
jgi:hypothetical protein